MKPMTEFDNLRIAVIGLGYVGLPLAIEFGKQFSTAGFDIKPGRIAEIRDGRDSTREVSPEEFDAADQLTVTSDTSDLAGCNFYVVTVPSGRIWRR